MLSGRTTENTAPVLLAACVMRALPSNGSMRQNTTFNVVFDLQQINTKGKNKPKTVNNAFEKLTYFHFIVNDVFKGIIN
jgi:hypothetical protein